MTTADPSTPTIRESASDADARAAADRMTEAFARFRALGALGVDVANAVGHATSLAAAGATPAQVRIFAKIVAAGRLSLEDVVQLQATGIDPGVLVPGPSGRPERASESDVTEMLAEIRRDHDDLASRVMALESPNLEGGGAPSPAEVEQRVPPPAPRPPVTTEPTEPGARVVDQDGDEWVLEGEWRCSSIPDLVPRSWASLVANFGPLHLAPTPKSERAEVTVERKSRGTLVTYPGFPKVVAHDDGTMTIGDGGTWHMDHALPWLRAVLDHAEARQDAGAGDPS